MPTNFYMFFVAALIPLVVGAIYYNPKVLGNAWMKSCGFTEESLKGGNMAVIFGVSYLFAVMIALTMPSITIHQTQVFSLLAPGVMESGSQAQTDFNTLMQTYGGAYRSFGHGALHGIFSAIFYILPIIGTIALFERRGWKYIFIHFGYWAITLILMGGVICATLNYPEVS